MSALLPAHLIAAAPDGIRKLRGLILELAVRGKLVPQDPNDEPANELLKRIEQERARLEKEGVFKITKAIPPVGENEQPFVGPEVWEFVRLGSILEMVNGRAFKPGDWRPAGVPIVRIQNLNNPTAPYNYCDAETLDDRHRLVSGDFLISWSGTPGTSFGAFIWNRGEAALNQHIFRCIQIGAGFTSEFLRLAINSQLNVLIAKAQGGVGLQHVTKGTLEALVLPLPPLAEQHRIVAKVDELMALCDRLEVEQADASSAHARLVETLLGTLTQSSDTGDLAANWQRLAEHFDTLFTTEASIDALKQTVLQLAVMGKLVSQNPNNEPASTLLKQIEQVRAQLVAEGVCKKAKPALSVSDDEQHFVIPENWHWSRLASFVSVLGDGLHGTPHYTPGTPYFFVNGNNLVNGEIVIKPETKTVSEAEFLKHSKPLSTSTVLVSINGSLGRVAFYAGEQVILGKSACFFNLLPPLNKRYIRLVLESPYFVTYAFRSATGTTIKNLGLKAMNDFPIPLPPIAEQHRIVAKVDELMALCERLKADLGTARQRQATLAETLLESALKAA